MGRESRRFGSSFRQAGVLPLVFQQESSLYDAEGAGNVTPRLSGAPGPLERGGARSRSLGKAGFLWTLYASHVNPISNRRKMMFYVNTAQTPEQIRSLRSAVDTWLRRHPDDKIVQRASRQLNRAEDRLRKAGKWH